MSFRAVGVVLWVIFHFHPLARASNALLDAELPPDGEPPIKELDGTNWVILRKNLTWGEASATCDKKYFRLAKLATKEKAEMLVDKIAEISEPFTDEYDKKNKEVEFGMDRRYWIGLTDQMQEKKWYWTHDDGNELTYSDFWYPNQPDHKLSEDGIKSREHCVTLWNPGYHEKDKHSYNDEDCLGGHYAICDKIMEPPEPPLAPGV
ncbi:unnamed protein product [Orchesella dallaii]|uniref:C-type lectin domain-containing protein n=1 Tax=Orchesella dallaii TaxID=48710 RepID=A0ABP1QW81_9HEXA